MRVEQVNGIITYKEKNQLIFLTLQMGPPLKSHCRSSSTPLFPVNCMFVIPIISLLSSIRYGNDYSNPRLCKMAQLSGPSLVTLFYGVVFGARGHICPMSKFMVDLEISSNHEFEWG